MLPSNTTNTSSVRKRPASAAIQQDAATNYAEAINHQLDRLKKPAEWSELRLDCGRAMGVLCQYAEATMFLERGLELERATSGPARALYDWVPLRGQQSTRAGGDAPDPFA